MSLRPTPGRRPRRPLWTIALAALGIAAIALLVAPRAAADCGIGGCKPNASDALRAGVSIWASGDESKS